MPAILRRYTPPTCTLEISAKDSPLSRWTDRAVLKHLRFQLSFDDPRLAADEQVTIRGDRTELEALCDAVESYVQARLIEFPLIEPVGDRYLVTELIAETPYSEPRHRETAIALSTAAINEPAASTAATGIMLQPTGITSHRLSLGSLATATESEIQLSTLQLFDLANALDEYTAESIAIPALSRPSWLSPSTNWMRAVAVAVVALGTTLSIAQLTDSELRNGAPTSSQTASSQDQQYSGVAILPESAESEMTAPRLDPNQLQTLPPPPPDAGQTENGNLPTVPLPSTAPVPPIESPRVASPRITTPNDSAVVVPSNPTIATAPEAAPDTSALQIPIEENEATTADRSAATTESFAITDDAADAAAEAPDPSAIIPQVAEVQTYFEERWQPPEGLTRSIEYRLRLSPDGTIQQVTPLGQTAETYLDRTGIPLMGEPFVSPIADGRSPDIRLVLSPDGQVRSLLETVN